MKITTILVDKLLRLRNGESIPASQLRGEWVDELLRDGVIISTSHGSRRTIFAPRPDAFVHALSSLDERLSDLDSVRDFLQTKDLSRSAQASVTGNSKLVNTRSCLGFPINSYEPISCILNGRKMIISPQEGSFLFITDWQSFTISKDVVVVGIENMENFRMIRQQRDFFEQTINSKHLLFVSRYPQSSDLRLWLQSIPNRYIHFGDFDLAGIHIFLTEFYPYLGERSSYLIPSDIERRLAEGSQKRYDDQYAKFHKLKSEIPSIQMLIDLINKYHKGYDQEGYIDGTI